MDLGSIGFAALNIFAIIFTIIFVGAVIFVIFKLYFKWKRYSQYHCTIFETTGFGQQVETYDRAGVFVDPKTGDKKFFLKKGNVGLDPENIPYIPAANGKKGVYLLKNGIKDYRFIQLKVSGKGLEPEVGEEDVNWAIHVYEKQKKMFSNSWFVEYGPFIALAFVSIIILVIFIYFFRKFDVLAEVARALERAAEHISAAQSGTMIVK